MTAPPHPALPLPIVTEAVNAEWLSRALAVPVSHAEVVDVILGTLTRIRVRIESNGKVPETLIVKGGFEAHSPSMKEICASEVAFNRNVQPVQLMPVEQLRESRPVAAPRPVTVGEVELKGSRVW